MKKSAGYHGIQNAKIAKGETITPLEYVKNLSLDPQINSTPQHADNRMVLNIQTHNGFTGNLGSTAKDPAVEKELGYSVDISTGGTGIVGGAGNVTLDGLYYEFFEEIEKGARRVVKAWLLSVELSPSSENYETDADGASFGDYVYPVTVYGSTLKAATGDTDYIDENGNRLTCYMILRRPDDTGYATFGDEVPVPKIKAEV